ncbi:hypothetical protein GW765_04775 [Candidatus Parcubacteria bacterium]|nr:hypothetical protein [Candidatus Parcubacteria bacterium]
MLPNFLQTALWSYDLKKMTKNRYKNLIITQILNFGDWRQLQWLLQNYSAKEIKEVLKNPARGMWRADVINYWEKIFNIRIPKSKALKALWPPYAK